MAEPVARLEHKNMSWSAIFAGALVALGFQILLSLLGTVLGFNAYSLSTNSFRAVDLGVILWTLAVPFACALMGGLVTGALAIGVRPGAGYLHGFLVWSLFAVFSLATLESVLVMSGTQMSIAKMNAGLRWLFFFGASGSLVAAILGATSTRAAKVVERRRAFIAAQTPTRA